jgi:dTDP-4-dehydrorhamnose 3,5-epimerase
MCVPLGLAHGFYVRSEWGELVYKATDYYAPEWDRSILWNDPEIDIDWPIPFNEAPLLSQKDIEAKRMREAELFD